MKIRILGYYGGFPAKGIGTSGYLLTSGNYHLLIDCGSGVLLTLEKYLDPLQLNAVILSHYHHDHTADVGVLQYYWQLHPKNRVEPVLPIYGNTEDPLNFGGLTWAHSTRGVGYSADEHLKIGPLLITFQRTHHPVPAFAMRILEVATGRTLVFTADSNYFSQLARFAKGTDVLLTDTNYYADKNNVKKRWHMTSTECGTLAKRAHCPHLVLSHLPQYGNLNQLVSEAQAAAGPNVKVERASVGKVVKI